MDPKTTLVLYAIIIIVIFAVVRKFFKLAFKILLAISITFSIVILILGFFVIKDVMDMKENLPKSESIFLFESGDKIVIGFTAKFSGEQEPELVSSEKLNEYDGLYKKQDFESIRKDYYKLFVFKMDSFSKEGEIEIFQDMPLKKELLQSVLASDDPVDVFVEGMLKEQGIDMSLKEQNKKQILATVGSGEKLKMVIAFMMFFDEISSDPLFLFNEYKDGNLIVYPRTAVFKFIKAIPTSTLKNAFSTAKGMVKEKINN